MLLEVKVDRDHFAANRSQAPLHQPTKQPPKGGKSAEYDHTFDISYVISRSQPPICPFLATERSGAGSRAMQRMVGTFESTTKIVLKAVISKGPGTKYCHTAELSKDGNMDLMTWCRKIMRT